jgi:hypothetical protein
LNKNPTAHACSRVRWHIAITFNFVTHNSFEIFKLFSNFYFKKNILLLKHLIHIFITQSEWRPCTYKQSHLMYLPTLLSLFKLQVTSTHLGRSMHVCMYVCMYVCHKKLDLSRLFRWKRLKTSEIFQFELCTIFYSTGSQWLLGSIWRNYISAQNLQESPQIVDKFPPKSSINKFICILWTIIF